MSSTNRSDARNNHVSDYYITPKSDIKKFLTKFIELEPDCFKGVVLDPCAGGKIGAEGMSYPEAIQEMNLCCDIITNDLREDSLAQHKDDFLQITPNFKFDCIITNPPFNIAEEIIRKSLELTKIDGFVIMLVRLNFFGSKKRQPFWKEFMPEYCFVHSERISFTGGTTDSIEYMHCCWRKGFTPDFTKLVLI